MLSFGRTFIIIEQSSGLWGIEIKAAATVTRSDFKGLKKRQAACVDDFVIGVVYYDGESILPFGQQLYAVPISVLMPIAA